MTVIDQAAVLEALRERRSLGAMTAEPVAVDHVREMLEAAVRAPNHKRTHPWRFVVVAGEARERLGRAHREAVAAAHPDAPPARLDAEERKPLRAPVIVAALQRRTPADPVVDLEDYAAVACACQNLLLAGHALGYATMWRTGAMVDERQVRRELGIGDEERVVGFVYVGRPDPAATPKVRELTPIDAITTWLT